MTWNNHCDLLKAANFMLKYDFDFVFRTYFFKIIVLPIMELPVENIKSILYH